uniref:(northern house mosquito) hypothetical protein n=1 Tax=Culex pipiens TaxID=7175 RepID=A0A8D8P953_CULPI
MFVSYIVLTNSTNSLSHIIALSHFFSQENHFLFFFVILSQICLASDEKIANGIIARARKKLRVRELRPRDKTKMIQRSFLSILFGLLLAFLLISSVSVTFCPIIGVK